MRTIAPCHWTPEEHASPQWMLITAYGPPKPPKEVYPVLKSIKHVKVDLSDLAEVKQILARWRG